MRFVVKALSLGFCCFQTTSHKSVKHLFSGFIEELGQDAAPPVPPPEGPFHQADDEPFDQLGQVLDCLIVQHQRFFFRTGAWSP